MGIGVSISLIAVGLVLAFAVTIDSIGPLAVEPIGWILVICGLLGLVTTMAIFAPRNRSHRSSPPNQNYPNDPTRQY